MDEFERRHELFAQYCGELNTFREPDVEQQGMFEMYENCEEYFRAEDCTWHDIWMDDQIIGFIVIGKHAPYCHPDTDYAICEAYILPEYRRRGLMTSVVRSLVEDDPGRYSLLVLVGNKYAQKFWPKVFASMRYKSCDLDEQYVDPHGDHVLSLGFEPSGRV
jgi:predicted acetyltransferase